MVHMFAVEYSRWWREHNGERKGGTGREVDDVKSGLVGHRTVLCIKCGKLLLPKILHNLNTSLDVKWGSLQGRHLLLHYCEMYFLHETRNVKTFSGLVCSVRLKVKSY